MKKETKEKLISALITLTERKALDDISISELTALATINRWTFYLAYEDFNDFILSLSEELLLGFKAQLLNHPIAYGLGEGMVDVFNYIYDNMALFKLFILDSVFDEKLERAIEDYIQAYHHFNTIIPMDYSRAILLTTTLSIIKLWIFEPDPKEVKEITAIFYKTRTIPLIDLAI